MEKYYYDRGISLDSIARINKKKNAVMRRIVEIRREKAKPKLTTLL